MLGLLLLASLDGDDEDAKRFIHIFYRWVPVTQYNGYA